MTMRHTRKFLIALNHDQRGFASIVIALTVVLVLALVTVGFAQLTRREQQNALTKQLAIQANYAAETGINDALKYIKADPTYAPDPKRCHDAPGQPPYAGPSKDIDTAVGVSYSCLLIDARPTSYQVDRIPVGEAKIITFSTDRAPANLVIRWGSTTPAKNTGPFPAEPETNKFQPQSTWPNIPGVLQVSITPHASADRTSLINNTLTSYLYPAQRFDHSRDIGGHLLGIGGTAGDGRVLSGHCDPLGADRSASYPCLVNINGGPLAAPGWSNGPFLVHILSYYDTSRMHITGTDTSGTPIRFINGQAVIDVTGKARDVLKRLRVRVALNPRPADLPNYTIEASNICKRLITLPDLSHFVDQANTGALASPGSPCILD